MKNFWKRLTGKKKGFTLVELMIVVAIIAILAGLAISQFGNTVKSAKSAEAQKFMKKVSQGAKGYFTTEQKDCPDGPSSGCKSPWHNTGGDMGAPIPFDQYTFPGGDGQVVNFIGDVPEGGSKLEPQDFADDSLESATLKRLGVELEDPLYFEYIYESTGTGDGAEASIIAEADFTQGGSNHREIQSLEVVEGDPQVNTAFTINENQ